MLGFILPSHLHCCPPDMAPVAFSKTIQDTPVIPTVISLIRLGWMPCQPGVCKWPHTPTAAIRHRVSCYNSSAGCCSSTALLLYTFSLHRLVICWHRTGATPPANWSDMSASTTSSSCPSSSNPQNVVSCLMRSCSSAFPGLHQNNAMQHSNNHSLTRSCPNIVCVDQTCWYGCVQLGLPAQLTQDT